MEPKTNRIIMYAHPFCPQIGPTRSVLKQAQAEFDYINIYEDLEAREHVREINNGYESVPTLLFPDGTTLTEPSAGELRNKLEAMGYRVPLTALVTGNLWLIFIIVGVALALLRTLGIF